jgi:DNA-binding NarL/FixJ family response regulator
MVRVSFCGDSVLAEELRIAFLKAGGFSLISCSRQEELPAILAVHRPDIVFLDSPADLTIDSISMLQYVASSYRIVLWMRSASLDVAFKTIPLGVRGAVLTTASIATVLRCLARVSEGELWFDKSLFGGAALLPLESELLRLLARSPADKELATATSRYD